MKARYCESPWWSIPSFCLGLTTPLRPFLQGRLKGNGLDTVEANEKLGFRPDLRRYGTGAQILKDLGVRDIRLMTNNPRKIVALEGYGLRVVERAPIDIEPNPVNARYLSAKRMKFGHLFASHR